jgi:hypothetical protein
MASQGMYQRRTRRIDLGNGLWHGDNQIKAADYGTFAAGFNGQPFSGKMYSNRFYVHQQGKQLRTKFNHGELVAREDGRLVPPSLTWTAQGADPSKFAALAAEAHV